MKKIIAIICSLVLLICSAVPAFSAEASFNEEAYEAAVAEIMKNYQENPEAALEALEELDTVLLGEPSITEYSENNNGDINTFATKPSDYTFSVYAFKRGNSANYYLQWNLTANKAEILPGELDLASLEWDTAYAKYYLSNGDNTISTVKGKNTGIVVFNIEDSKLKKGTLTYGTVQVTPLKRGELEFGSKFVHTYSVISIEAASLNFSYVNSKTLKDRGEDSLGRSYTFGFTVSVSGKTKEWSRWVDNAVTL